MGRKFDLKKIENVTRCQVTFSKRRSSLIKKAHEISVFCDVDVAFLAFSPSGRLSKFSSQKRIEDVLERYVNLPPDKKYVHIKKVEEKLEKLQQLDHIVGENKLQHLNQQIEHMERQIKIKTLELQIQEANLRDFEPDPEQDPSLAQLLWCERNLKNSLRRVMDRKRGLLCNLSSPNGQFNGQMERENQGGTSFLHNAGENQLNQATENPTASQLQFQLDPWLSSYSPRVRETILQELLNMGKGISQGNGSEFSMPDEFTCNVDPVTGSPIMQQWRSMPPAPATQIQPTNQIPMQQALLGNGPMPGLPNQQLITADSSIMRMDGPQKPYVAPQQPTQMLGPHEMEYNISRQDAGIPRFLNNTNPGGNWFANDNYNPSPNSNVIMPMNINERNLSTLRCESHNNISSSSSCSNNGSLDVYEKHLAAPEKVYAPEDNARDLVLPNGHPIEAVMRNGMQWTAPLWENDSWKWDGSVLQEDLNLEDFDILY